MIDLGFSENDMIDECLPLTPRVGDYNEFFVYLMPSIKIVAKLALSLKNFLFLMLPLNESFGFRGLSESTLERDICDTDGAWSLMEGTNLSGFS